MKQSEFLEIIEQNKGKHRQPIETYVQGRKVFLEKSDNVQPFPPYPSIPNDTIIYKASAKLENAGGTWYPGFHPDKFYDENGDQLSIVSHDFENGTGTIKFSGNIINIGVSAFNGCNTMTDIIIPSSVEKIVTNSFSGVGLTSIIIPDNVTYLGQAFTQTNISVIYSRPEIAPAPAESVADSFASSGILYVPVDSTGYEDWINKLISEGKDWELVKLKL